ncbi:MAG: SAM-dependent methyltransferase, partial [Pseudonocardiaceae bacterium]
HPQTKQLLDLDRPVGLLMLAVLHFVPDSWDPVDIVARYRNRLAPGSYLALSHVTTEGNLTGLAEALQFYEKTPEPMYLRGYDAVLRFFAGFELVESGLVGCAFWRPSGPGDGCDSAEMSALAYAGVGRKP